jgi:hypothetical protein
MKLMKTGRRQGNFLDRINKIHRIGEGRGNDGITELTEFFWVGKRQGDGEDWPQKNAENTKRVSHAGGCFPVSFLGSFAAEPVYLTIQ